MNNGASVKSVKQFSMSASLKEAIEEQQARVWRLRNLIACVRVVSDSSEDVDDFGAAISGLQDYADDTCMALDAGTIVERAERIREEAKP